MEYVLERRGEGMDQIFDAEFYDAKYTNSLVGSTYRKTANYYINGKKCLSFKDNETLYAIITWLNHSDGKETCCCPDCGTISRAAELTEGRSPIISYHYGAENHKELKNLFRKSLMITGAASILLTAVAIIALPLFIGLDGIWLAVEAAEMMAMALAIFFFVQKKNQYHYA